MMEVLEPPQEQPSKNDSPGSTKSKCIRSLLMEGWKNRWTEVEWGINIKRVLPRGVSGDVYDLAEGIIQQGLVGRSPNKLMLSFLTHSLNAGIVSFGAVIGAIASYNDFDKHDCIAALLDILLSFKHRIIAGSVTGIGNEEESIRLATSLVGICNWSFQYLKHVSLALTEIKKNIGTCAPGQTQSTVEVNGGQVLKDNAEKIAVFLGYLLSNSFLISMFNIGKNEDSEEYQKLRESFNNFVELEKHCKSIQSFPENDCFDKVFQFMSIIDWTPETPALLTYEQLTNGSSSGKNTCSNLNTPCSSVFSSLNAVIAFNAVLDPLSEISSISQTLLNIAKFNSLPLSDLVMEITRCCFIGLVDAGSDKSLESSSTYELKWAAFTFLKMPRILTSIVKMTKEETQGNIVEEGISKLLTFSPLLDQTDCRSNCDCISLLLKELEKVNLVSEKKVCELTAKRRSESAKSSNLGVKEMSSNQQPQSSLILKAEPTVTSILETLDVDYSKNQDGLLEVLCHMPGKSFELIMIAAAATGNFKHFTMKLLKFNEFNKQATGETEKASLTRALLFDVTFLMLCQISQNYGPEVITSIPETQSCFFSSWCSQSFPQSGSFQCPDSMLENCDPSRVDVILNQLANSKSDFKTSLVKWHEYCTNVPAAIKEVVTAWQVGAVSTKEVKVMLDTLKSKMCCIPIVVSTWLCSYISIIPKQNRRKPMEMLKMLITQTTPPAPTTPIVEGSIDMGMIFQTDLVVIYSTVVFILQVSISTEKDLR
jgi:mediator of RNA polymerase II transcription subunit 24